MNEILKTDEVVDVAIIGGGPAGVAAAIELRRHGVARVAILERDSAIGGVPRHCGHPPFGMFEFGRVLTGPAYARRLQDAAIDAGVDIRLRHCVVAIKEQGNIIVASPNGTYNLAAQRVVIATGIREASRAARLISGDRPIGVLNTGALQAHIYLKHLLPFRRPLIVGTELVSLSAVLTCWKAGMRTAALVEGNWRPTVYRPLMLFPRLVGVPVHYRSIVADIRGRTRVESVVVRSDDGREHEIDCDGVLFTGSFTPEASLARMSHLELDPGSGGPAIDQYGRCSDAVYFAAGNVLRAVETAGWSFREGRRVGRAVAQDLTSPTEAEASEILIHRGLGIKSVTPQRLLRSPRPQGFDHIQIRVANAMKGQLVAMADDAVIWRKKMSALPERRILIPLADLAIPSGASNLRVGFVD